MKTTICLYEDKKFSQFYPMTCLRPVFSLRAGIRLLYERVFDHFPEAPLCVAVRKQISGLVASSHRDLQVNIVKKSDGGVLFLNGRLRQFGDLPKLVAEAGDTTIYLNNGEIVAVLFKGDTTQNLGDLSVPEQYTEAFDAKLACPRIETSATLYNYLWEIMADIGHEISSDFAAIKVKPESPRDCMIHDGVYLLNEEQVRFGKGVKIYPNVVINAEKGPVYIGAHTTIEPDVTINGPCYIGPNTIIMAGKISCSSIGHTCRVGGEVEESVFHSYVNKYHAGFIGHSYVGPWVNFGAMTTNSDLKNNYSPIRLTVNGQTVDSGSIKVGSFIGDHTKFGIGTLLNTGINIGLCSNIFGGTLIADKEVPSFSWGSGEPYDRYDFDKAIMTIKRTVARRSAELSSYEQEMLKAAYEDDFSPEGVMDFVID